MVSGHQRGSSLPEPSNWGGRGSRPCRNRIALVLAGLFAAVPALADETAKAAPEAITTPSLTYSLLRVLGALAIVFAVLFGGAWIVRNGRRFVSRGVRDPKLNVLEAKSLGARQALYVVGYERQRFLISCAPAGISMLTVLPDSAASEQIGTMAPPSFADALAQALSPLGRTRDWKIGDAVEVVPAAGKGSR